MSQDSTTSLSRRLPVLLRSVDGQPVNSVLGRDLHRGLSVGRDYSNWFRDRCGRLSLLATTDYEVFAGSGENRKGGRPRIDHVLTLTAAKKIAMGAGGVQGVAVREYFLECERAVLEPAQLSRAAMTLLVIQGLQEDVETERSGRLLAESTIEDQRPAVEFALDVIKGDGDFSTREAIKAVGSPVKLGPSLWRALEGRKAFFVAARNGNSRHWRPCLVKAGFGYDCVKHINGRTEVVLVPVWKPKGLPHLREWLLSRDRQERISRP